MTPAALDGIRVLELAEGWTAAALAGRLLAELGAEVVKVERAEGDPLREETLAFPLAAAGKRSLALEGRSGTDRRALDSLLGWSDVLLADETGVRDLATLDLALPGLPASRPHLIACAATPFGLDGPRGGAVGGELTLQAASGVMSCTGYPERPPMRAGVALGAHVTALLAVTGVLAALRVRERGGPGQVVDLAVHDGLVSCLGTFLPTYFLSGQAPGRLGNRHSMVAPWNAYPCRDGWAVVCAGDAQWASVLRQIGRGDLLGDARYATLPSRVSRVDEVDAILSAWTRARAVAEVVRVMGEGGIPAGPIASVPELLASPHFRARGMVLEVPGAAGPPVTTAGSLFTLSVTPGRVTRGAPALGEATEEIRRAAERAPRRPPPTRDDPGPPLEGVRVLEMGAFTAAPHGARLLASLGADVLKLEPSTGEPARHLAQRLGGDGYLYHVNNTDKRSAILDIAAPGARARFLELCRGADAFVENFAPGTTERWGIGPAAVWEAAPRLVYCSISGFGHAGPLSGERAFDTVIQAMAGLMAVTGEADDPPVKVGLSIADLLGGCLAAAAILAALRHRDRSGSGQHLDISMHDLTGWLTAGRWPEATGGAGPARLGNRHPRHAPHNVFAAADGRLVALEVRSEAEWGRLLQVLGEAAPAEAAGFTAARRRAEVATVEGWVAGWVAGRPAADAVARCQARGVPAAVVATVAEVAEDAHTRQRAMVIVREHPTLGPIRLLGTPFHLGRTPARVTRTAPALGAHEAEVEERLTASARRA